jgi:hypothetical protein
MNNQNQTCGTHNASNNNASQSGNMTHSTLTTSTRSTNRGTNNHSTTQNEQRNISQQGQQHGQQNHGNNRNNHNNSGFQGETAELKGKVFQVHSEQRKRGQFQDTLSALKVYASTVYRKDINSLTCLFTELKVPSVEEPVEAEKRDVKNEDGTYSKRVTKFTQTVFNDWFKQWIKETNSLKATLQSLYKVVWGQCSKLMQNKLKALKHFQDMENKGDVTTPLKEIRGISHQLESNTSVYDSLDEAKRRFYAYKQSEEDSNAQHLQNFKTTMEVIEHFFMMIPLSLLRWKRTFRNQTWISISKQWLW